MSTVFCVRNKKELPALSKKPLPGEIGERVLKELSQEAWNEWISTQTMMINEYRMNLMNPSDRKILYDMLIKFLNGEEIDKPGEYKK